MSTTPNLDLEQVPSNSLQPSVPVNDAFQVLDALIVPGGIIQDKDLTTPPTTVIGDVGKTWIVAAGATGLWSGQAGNIALCTAAVTWRFFVPTEGWTVYVLDENCTYKYSGSAWVIDIVPATLGGTGQSVYTVGDILYANTTTTLAKLAAGTSGHVVTSNGPGVAPSYQAGGGGGGITALTGDVTASGTGSVAATLATAQPAVHTWALAQTFTVAPIFTDASGSRTALGLGTAATQNTGTSGANLPFANGTNTWANAQTFTTAPVFTDQSGSRTALGLGTSATVNTGTSGATIPLLNAANTWGTTQTFTVAPVFTDASGTRTALGLGTAATQNTGTSGSNVPLLNGTNTHSGQNTFAAGTITTSQPFTITQTWNDGGVPFNGYLMNITDTASAAASALFDLQIGSSSRIKGLKTGAIQQTASGGSICALTPSTDYWAISVNAVNIVGYSKFNWISHSSSTVIGFTSSAAVTSAPDTAWGRAAANSIVESASGVAGSVLNSTRMRKSVTAIADNTATATFTVTVPNAAHSASLMVRLTGSLGAGGAIGANEATGTICYNIAIARTAGVNAVAQISSAHGSSTASVAGAATITVSAGLSAISGAVGATNTFTVNVTIARGSGSSTNHTCHCFAELQNANATGITIS